MQLKCESTIMEYSICKTAIIEIVMILFLICFVIVILKDLEFMH